MSPMSIEMPLCEFDERADGQCLLLLLRYRYPQRYPSLYLPDPSPWESMGKVNGRSRDKAGNVSE